MPVTEGGLVGMLSASRQVPIRKRFPCGPLEEDRRRRVRRLCGGYRPADAGDGRCQVIVLPYAPDSLAAPSMRATIPLFDWRHSASEGEMLRGRRGIIPMILGWLGIVAAMVIALMIVWQIGFHR